MEFNTTYILRIFCPFMGIVIRKNIVNATGLRQELGDVKALGGTLHASTIAQLQFDVQRYKECARHESRDNRSPQVNPSVNRL
jgi:hypothetical protein